MENPYWKKESVSLEEAFSLAEELFRRIGSEELDFKEYKCCAGDEPMDIEGHPRAKARVFWSPIFQKSGVDLWEDSWKACAMYGDGKWDGEFRLLGYGDGVQLEHGFVKMMEKLAEIKRVDWPLPSNEGKYIGKQRQGGLKYAES